MHSSRSSLTVTSRTSSRQSKPRVVLAHGTPDRNEFFSIPLGIVCRRAQLPPLPPGEPGPLSLGAPGVIGDAFTRAGFGDIRVSSVSAPVRMPSVAGCVRFGRDSCGALHQMLAGVAQAEREHAWAEIERELARLETPTASRDRASFSSPPGTK